jgi:hypothetical protein
MDEGPIWLATYFCQTKIMACQNCGHQLVHCQRVGITNFYAKGLANL